MKLTFIGADHEVTGSCHYIEAGGTRLIVDYGMEQGENIYENVELPCTVPELDFVLLTHAHIDHAGLLPLLYSRGFKGRIYATAPTCDLCDIMLKDSAHIQEMEAEWKNRKAQRAGRQPEAPLYGMNDAVGVLAHFVPCAYHEVIELNRDVSVRFVDAGHLLGSASIEVWLKEEGQERKIVFSGDLGNPNKPMIRNPDYVDSADYVVIESTYGDRFHKKGVDHVQELTDIIQETLDRGGNVVIPAFAVGRTQELLYFIRRIKQEHRIHGHEDFQVFVDSPLAVEATSVFSKNMLQCVDEETRELIAKGVNPISFNGLQLSITSEESKNINFDSRPKVIISASGMCDAGRIRHHLKHNLWRKECTIVFAGYQAVGTLGRTLVDGGESVKIFGESIDVEAQIAQMEGISGHADQNGLMTWIGAFKEKPEKIFVVHGDDKVCDSFADNVGRWYQISAEAPFSGSEFDLIEGCWLKVTQGVPVSKASEAAKRATGVYRRLVSAGERLMQVIRRSEGGANKDLAKFADQIHSLCDKWDR